MALVEIICVGCGKTVQKPVGEVIRSRKLGRRLFCSCSCAATTGNLSKRSVEVVKTCPVCGVSFKSSTGRRAKSFCSRSCASKGSMNEDRREAQRQAGREKIQNLLSPAETLRLRESWKYTALREVLSENGRDFEFEYELGEYVFDLALLDTRVVVEFDGDYHRGQQIQVDDLKDRAAMDAGFTVVRRAVEVASVISPVVLRGL